jgi:hypothetical protein
MSFYALWVVNWALTKITPQNPSQFGGILGIKTGQARRQEDFSKVRRVGIDETASHRGHNYITLVHDMDARRLIFGCSGRDQATIASFVKDLKAHQGDPLAINAACIDKVFSMVLILASPMDMSRGLIA